MANVRPRPSRNAPAGRSPVVGSRPQLAATIVALLIGAASLWPMLTAAAGSGDPRMQERPTLGRPIISTATPTAAPELTPTLPAGSPAAATPAVQPEARCSTVLGVGESGDACLAIVHAAPYAGAVDVYGGGDELRVVATLSFDGFADFTAFSSDERLEIAITTAGDAATIALEEAFELAPDQAYVLVVENRFPDYALHLTLLPLSLAPLETDRARVMLYHAVSDAGPLAMLGLPAPLDQGIEANASGEPAEILAGRYEVTVVPDGARETVLMQGELQPEAGLSYVVVLTGLTTDATVTFTFAAAPVAADVRR